MSEMLERAAMRVTILETEDGPAPLRGQRCAQFRSTVEGRSSRAGPPRGVQRAVTLAMFVYGELPAAFEARRR